MSTPRNHDMVWLEGVLYSGLRGLSGSDPQKYRDQMAKLVVEPTPQLLEKAGIGWLFTEKSRLWGESPQAHPTRLFVFAGNDRRAVTSVMSYLHSNGDSMVVICGPKTGSSILSLAYIGGRTSGLLTSSTSRNIGVLRDTDIRGSVLSLLGITPERLAHRWSVVPADAVTSRSRCERIIRLCTVNEYLIVWVGVVAAIACILLIGSCLAKSTTIRGLGKPRAVFAAGLAMLPLATCELGRWIVTGLYQGDRSGLLLLASCLLGGVLCCVAVRLKAWAAVRLVMLLTICYVSVAALLGYEWVFTSVISSYVLTGIRLYGVGNEFMGILVGGCLMMISLSGDKRMATILLALLAVIFAAGAWGANLGGFATCVAAIISLSLFGQTIYKRKIGYGLALAAGLASALIMVPWPMLIDSMMPSPTHMGEAAIRASLLGQNAIVTMFTSKLHLFIQIVTMPFGMLSIAGFVIVLWYSTHRMRQHTTPERASQYLGWVQIGGFASVPALVFNDSGIVPAVIIMACVMIYALLLQSDGGLTPNDQG